MGKKANKRKKQANNQRGYSTTSTAPSKAPSITKVANPVATSSNNSASHQTTVSSKDHNELLRLLVALDDEDHSMIASTDATNSNSYISPDRFYKKLFNIYDTLTQLGFSFETIQRVVVTLGYAITLETALDWLCLHLSTEDLPPLLTEGSVRERERLLQSNGTAGSGKALEVLKPTKLSGATHKGSEHSMRAAPVPPHLLKRNRDQKETSKSEANDDQSSAKAWILQQYQFEEDEKDHEEEKGGDGGNDVATEKVAEATTKDPTPIHQELTTVATPTPEPEQSPELPVDPNQERLEEMEQTLQEQEADLKDEASNYMRSKQEIKQMQINAKKLRQQVQGLRKKVEKAKAAAKEGAAKAAAANDDSGDMMGGGFFGGDDNEDEEEEFAASLFDQPMQSAVVSKSSEGDIEKEDLPPPSDPVTPKGSVPSGWTGKTPKDILDDWCKKEKVRKPQYFKLPTLNGARIRVDTQPTPVSRETDNYMGSYVDAQQYLATKVLYQLNPDLPLYRLFPPYHRDLWKSWSESVQNEKEAVQKLESDEVAAKIQQLIDSVPKLKPPAIPSRPKTTEKQAEVQRSLARDCWDDDDGGDNINFDDVNVPALEHEVAVGIGGAITSKQRYAKPTRAGEVIQKEFQRRQRTSQYQSMLEVRTGLPMYSFREQIIKTIKENAVTILCAEVRERLGNFD